MHTVRVLYKQVRDTGGFSLLYLKSRGWIFFRYYFWSRARVVGQGMHFSFILEKPQLWKQQVGCSEPWITTRPLCVVIQGSEQKYRTKATRWGALGDASQPKAVALRRGCDNEFSVRTRVKGEMCTSTSSSIKSSNNSNNGGGNQNNSLSQPQ